MEYKNQTENRAFQEMLQAAVKRLQNRSGEDLAAKSGAVLHFAPVSGHWCVCQWPLGATSGRKLIDYFVFDHNVIMFCYPLKQRVG